MDKSEDNLLFKEFPHRSRCKAKSKRTGEKCKSSPMTGYNVCYHHGAKGGAPKGHKHGMYKTGLHTQETISEFKEAKKLIKSCRNFIISI